MHESARRYCAGNNIPHTGESTEIIKYQKLENMNKTKVAERISTLEVEIAQLKKDLNIPEEGIKKEVTERVKTFSDVLSENLISNQEWEEQNVGLSKDEIAYRAIKLIAKALNEGWEPDWDDDDQYKYYPYFEWSVGSGFSFFDYGCVNSHSFLGSRLYFKSSELATYAGKQFISIYNDYLN